MIPEDRRVMPETRPDTEAAEHRLTCLCVVCQRLASKRWKAKTYGIRS